jgi:hypothetical protein
MSLGKIEANGIKTLRFPGWEESETTTAGNKGTVTKNLGSGSRAITVGPLVPANGNELSYHLVDDTARFSPWWTVLVGVLSALIGFLLGWLWHANQVAP